MRTETTYLVARDGKQLFVRAWLPEGVIPFASSTGQAGASPAATDQPRAVIQLAHGMAEHSARYERFATQATQAGYVIVADDHRGHGGTIASADERGHTHDVEGWELVLSDLSVVREAIDAAWPEAPVVLFGHSWGSMLVRGWVASQGERSRLAGLIAMGTMASPGLLGPIGMRLAQAEVRLSGPRHPSALLEKQAFAANNKPFAPVRTDYDWLSRDEVEVDRYIADPLSGQRCTAAFYRDLTHGAMEVNRPQAFAAVPKDLPVLVISGDQDPVGGMGRGVRQVATDLRRAGVRDVTLRLYPGARHELLNEVNREEVTADLMRWIGQRV
ncbi:MAG: S33 family lysophosphospholipase [Actinomyces urogenitalis DORA_12]|uniref:S33 family lysophosphospholipase n=1 Tax=Actinomyces urogenitalis DORA_12 TaxID=1403939 RepID=W1VML0_9ACTO|nr:MAG: S33 family lysophosphospholipase [Actinomyces urogenitalis DORA_12]MDU7429222.1 alpha/beta fold hydrolase [Actinomyces urogenitalis]